MTHVGNVCMMALYAITGAVVGVPFGGEELSALAAGKRAGVLSHRLLSEPDHHQQYRGAGGNVTLLAG